MTDYGKFFENKRVLITGGTGSIGTILTKTLLSYGAKSITLMSRHEDLQVQKRREFPQANVKFLLGDVRDYERCLTATSNIDVVLHAAALKHVSEVERHPEEAIKTNVIGTINIKRAAIYNNVQNVLGISTDKAVKPVNAYGMTKALDERILLNEDTLDSTTKFSIVRYGNVLGSRGSVVPYWYNLAKNGERLPLTDQKMTRFWLTLPEAVQLIFRAIQNEGLLTVKKCKSFKLLDLANIYSQKFNVKSEVVGIRPGEKVHEALLTDSELRKATLEDDYYTVDFSSKDKNNANNDFTSENADQIQETQMIEMLKKEGFYE